MTVVINPTVDGNYNVAFSTDANGNQIGLVGASGTLHVPTFYGTTNGAKIVSGLFNTATTTYSQTNLQVTVTIGGAGHGIPNVSYLNGGKIYLPAASSGGLTAGWYTSFAVTGATTFTCNSTTNQSIAGNLVLAVYTDETPLITYSVPANVLGTNGVGHLNYQGIYDSTAGTKTFKSYYGAFNFNSASPTTTTRLVALTSFAINGDTQKQIDTSSYGGGGNGVSSQVPLTGTVDSTLTQSASISLTLNTGTDYAALLTSEFFTYYN